ncbi:hypothetical protein A9Z42_0007960 [Trichoderma parareesei]|uniref:DBF4-type domain-containing protein n=1 Tax=Trichoderma parareesei TaxID=858221 RepID=A0A2H2ZAC1_TRIPA|nr:hypothetical protein A9Z42_0007960 [Trichoderma parareesei]
MSSKRAPLASNPNVANSPLRAPSLLAGFVKPKRPFATVQREEPYGQPPPVKKQALENGAQKPVRSPSKLTRPPAHIVIPRNPNAAPRPVVRDRAAKAATASTTRGGQDVDTEKEVWKKHHRAKFPKMVFYFESIPDDIRAKLTKRVTYLGARQEPFFSIEVTHVVTTRAIPPEKPAAGDAEPEVSEEQEPQEQPQTINPSLLDRNTAARRRLLFDFRQASSVPSQVNDPAKRKAARNNDVLHKARDMGKKIWSLDKFQSMLAVLLESETQSYGSRSASSRSQYGTKSSHEPNLFQLLHNERINGPSDRDPTATTRELTYFKGPYLYIWDMDERQKPIMVREYAKVANKTDGEWPQFRSVGNGRCPFVEEVDAAEKEYRKAREREKARLAAKEESVQILKAPDVPPMKPVTGKRTLTEMEEAHNRVRASVAAETFQPIKATFAKPPAPSTQNAFISRAEGGRTFGGEPVASGIQNTITSAIRSQMISSTSGINGAKAGTSKEVHGLQRKVLQMTHPASHDASRRRPAEVPAEVASSRSLSRTTSKTIQGQEDDGQKAEKKAPTQQLKSKRDLKPGYCENCQDKFRDFDEHILSRKHRKFAENDDNWIELDALLAQLKRIPKYSAASDESDGEW